ncbi:MAG TPA: hypothetical protein VK608_02895, partial [Edaphobacter sp.]|nr:hypothetical protein [Edaphobacter sp.]
VPEDMRVIADYQRVPASLCMWSGPTAPGGAETEIVLPPKNMQNADLKGKLVLGGRMSKDRTCQSRRARHGSRECDQPGAVG